MCHLIQHTTIVKPCSRGSYSDCYRSMGCMTHCWFHVNRQCFHLDVIMPVLESTQSLNSKSLGIQTLYSTITFATNSASCYVCNRSRQRLHHHHHQRIVPPNTQQHCERNAHWCFHQDSGICRADPGKEPCLGCQAFLVWCSADCKIVLVGSAKQEE